MSAEPRPRAMTAEQLAELPDDAHRVDLVEGELRRMTPAGFEHGRLAMLLGYIVMDFVRRHHLGVVVAAETGFVLQRAPDTVLAPDVAFIAADRAPGHGEQRGFAELTPDLVVEVVSPSDRASEVVEKALLWLDAGARLVWIVDASEALVTAYEPNGVAHLLRGDDVLHGGDVLPGFSLRLSELFG